MICSSCGNDTPAPFDICRVCRTPLPRHLTDIQPAAAATHLESAPPALAGVLGRYRIIRALGAGGMGHVYLAWDQDLGEHVAQGHPVRAVGQP